MLLPESDMVAALLCVDELRRASVCESEDGRSGACAVAGFNSTSESLMVSISLEPGELTPVHGDEKAAVVR